MTEKEFVLYGGSIFRMIGKRFGYQDYKGNTILIDLRQAFGYFGDGISDQIYAIRQGWA